MKRFFTLPLIALFSAPVWAGAGSTHGTAVVLEEGQWEIGLYAALRRGFSDGLELSIHPVTAFQSPHLGIKKSWSDQEDTHWASRHSLIYPTPLLKSLAREGTGGILAADSILPHIVVSDNRVMHSREISENTTVTVSGRLMLAASFGESNWTGIHMPLAYPRTAAYQDGLASAAGIQIDGIIVESIRYRVDLDGWYLPLSAGQWALEAKGTIPWQPSESFTAQATATAIFAEYPYGTAWHLLPGFDFIFSW